MNMNSTMLISKFYLFFSKLLNLYTKPAISAFILSHIVYCTREKDIDKYEFKIFKKAEIDEVMAIYKKEILFMMLSLHNYTPEEKLKNLSYEDLKKMMFKLMGINQDEFKKLRVTLEELQNIQKEALEKKHSSLDQKLKEAVEKAQNTAQNETLVHEEKSYLILFKILKEIEDTIDQDMKEKFQIIDKTLTKLNNILNSKISNENDKKNINTFFDQVTKKLQQISLNLSKNLKNAQVENIHKELKDKELKSFRDMLTEELKGLQGVEEETIETLLGDVEVLFIFALELTYKKKYMKNLEKVFAEMKKTQTARISAFESLRVEIEEVLNLMGSKINEMPKKTSDKNNEDRIIEDITIDAVKLTETDSLDKIIQDLLKETQTLAHTFKISLVESINKKLITDLKDEMFNLVKKTATKAVAKEQNIPGELPEEIKTIIESDQTKQILNDELVNAGIKIEEAINKNADIDGTLNILENTITKVITETNKRAAEQVVEAMTILNTASDKKANENELIEKLKAINEKLSLFMVNIERKPDIIQIEEAKIPNTGSETVKSTEKASPKVKESENDENKSWANIIMIVGILLILILIAICLLYYYFK